MKKTLTYIILLLGLTHLAISQVSLQCPPCLPVTGCDQCWESVAAAESAGCTSAAKTTDLLNQVLVSDESLLGEIAVYPNPSYDGYFTIESTIGFTGDVKVIDASGRLLIELKLEQAQRHQFKQQLTQGLYFMSMESLDGRQIMLRLLVNQ